MVFSFPNYLDHPNLHQFNQHQEHHHQSTGVENHHLQPLPPPPPPLVVGGVGGAGSIRPGSMVDRARILKMPPPEAGAKCPRCDSTNTKFCYYNNYNLSQPRHFCKGCRRYWTKGGALRNVPVGGGCRRNKRSKNSGSSSSKSTAGEERQIGTSNNNNSTNSGPMSPSIRGLATNIAGHHFQQASTQLPLMAALQNFNQYSVPESGSQVHGLGDIRFNIGSNNLSITGGSTEPPVWMLPSFQGGFDAPNPSANLFHFQREGVDDHHQLPPMAGSSNDTSSVKMENHQNRNNQELNLSRQFLDSSSTAPQQNWSANAWTNGFSGLNSSSSSHLL
ncbi:hypothetical protein LIER_15513 [Lithospermum erythrorhizon]|uniref:Dof zinc finger protein n=1 Tax=Lithospermum erythrorhizon TaxID=34254 RepID=A0AAV3Q5Q1_LITER